MPSRSRYVEPDPDHDRVDPRIVRQRQTDLRAAKLRIATAAELAGPHMAVVLLNDALREALDRLREEEGGRRD